MTVEKNELLKAFPTSLKQEVFSVLNLISQSGRLGYSQFFEVKSCGEILRIPKRIYYDEPFSTDPLTEIQKIIFHCLFTRHTDGFIREKSVREIIPYCNLNPWIVPYLIRIIGEYVIEILQLIKDNIALIDKDLINAFISENQKFYITTENRVVSYWNCYYRLKYPKKEDYVGFQILKHFKT